MSNLGILVKNYLNCALSAFRGKNKKRSTLSAIVLLLVLGIACLGLYGFEAYTMFVGFKEVKLFSLPLFHGIMISLTVLLIIAVMRVSGKAKGNDTDLMLSLPVTKAEVIVAKALNRYLFDFLFMFLLFVPFLVLYQVFTKFSLAITVCGTVATFIIPLLSVGISYIYDFIITRIFNRLKAGNILKSLTSVFVFVLIMALMVVKTFTYGIAEAGSIDVYFADRFFSNLFLQFVLKQDVFSIVFCVGLCLICFVVGLYLFAVNFGKSFVGYSAKAGNLKFDENMGGFRKLFKKELNFYASTPAYIVNTCLGSVMILVLSVLISITGSSGIEGLLGVALDPNTIALVLTIGFCFATASVYITACSISLEGKRFWIIKTAPVSETTVFMVKICLNVLMVTPFVVFSSVLATICLGISFEYFLVMMFAPILLNIVLSIAGLLINLWLPKMDWQDETQVVKQGLASLVSMLLGMFLALIPMALLLIFDTLSVDTVIILGFALYGLLGVIFSVLLFTVGKKLYRKL